MKFWDSSAVVPLLIRQSASTRVALWFREDSLVVLSVLTPVEITSALWRLVRERKLTEEQALLADTRNEGLAAASHVVMDVNAINDAARRLLRVHGLRAADALQLGAALVWAAQRAPGKTFYTLDDRLALAARLEGFTVP